MVHLNQPIRGIFDFQQRRQDELNALLNVNLHKDYGHRYNEIKAKVCFVGSPRELNGQFKQVMEFNEKFKPLPFLKKVQAVFEEKATEVLRQSSLLKTRWIRLCIPLV